MPVPYLSTSIRLRILLGFTAVIMILAIANLTASSSLRGLDKNTRQVVKITHFVSQTNLFTSAIKQQASALQSFAYSARETDQSRVEDYRLETQTHKDALVKLLRETHATDTVEQIESVSANFNTVFTRIENRLGNTTSAINVGLNGLLGMEKSSTKLIEFIQQHSDSRSELTQQIRPAVAEFIQSAATYIASGKTDDFTAATQASEVLGGLLSQTKDLSKGLSRRQKAPLRFFKRDLDVIRQSISQHQATSISLSQAIEQLRAATDEVVAVTAGVKRQVEKNQTLALEQMTQGLASSIADGRLALTAGGVIAFIFAALIGNSIAGPIGRISSAMTRLAEGHKTIDIPYQTKTDELGTLARAASVFKEKSLELERIAAAQMQAELDKTEAEYQRKIEHEELIGEQRKRELATEEVRQQTRIKQRNAMADGFEQRVIRIAGTVSDSSSQIAQASKAFTDNTSQTKRQVDNTHAASDQSSQHIKEVVSASRDLSLSCREVVNQLEANAEVAVNAVSIGAETTDIVTELTEAATQIGEVMNIIADIAEQTNLLALNATIEAARAGDAGKGFAVVAQEVKNLSAQSTNATQDIARHVDKIQQVSADTAKAIGKITGIISHMDTVTQSVTNTMQQQFHATTQITSKVQQVARGIHTVIKNIDVVGNAAEANKSMSESLLTNAQALTVEAETLDNEARRFLHDIRNEAAPSTSNTKVQAIYCAQDLKYSA